MMNFSKMKTVAYSAPVDYIRQAVKLLRDAGYQVEFSSKDGTMVASFTDNGQKIEVARALKIRTTWCLRACPEVMSPA